MDLIEALLLIVGLLFALNHMVGGRSSSINRPATGIVSRLLTMIARDLVAFVGSVFRLEAGSIKLPK
jgi:hypothetical protein